MTGQLPLPKQVLQSVRFSTSSFKYQILLLKLPSGRLRLLPPFRVPSIFPFIFPSIKCFRKQFFHTMWQNQLSFFFLFYVGCSFPFWLYVIILSFSQTIHLIDLLHHSPENNSKFSKYFWCAQIFYKKYA